MQKLCCVRTIQKPLPVWIIVTSLPTHISINSHPFPVGIVSHRASIKQKVIDVSQKLDEDQETLAEIINFC